jgi:transcriptional regulator with XRE-family HTH domain
MLKKVDPLEAQHHLGKRIRSLRKVLKMSQVELAHRMGSSQVTISRYERGQEAPGTMFLWNLCVLGKVTPNYFFLNEKDEKDEKMKSINLEKNVNSALDLVSELSQVSQEYLVCLITYLFRAQYGQAILDERGERFIAGNLEMLRFLDQGVKALEWTVIEEKFRGVPLDILAQFSALTVVAGARGWNTRLIFEGATDGESEAAE